MACRLRLRSPESARWTSIFRPEQHLRSRKTLEQGRSDCEAPAFWPRAVFFCVAGSPVLPLSFSLCPYHSQAIYRGVRNRRIMARMAAPSADDADLSQLEGDGTVMVHHTRPDVSPTCVFHLFFFFFFFFFLLQRL